MANNRNIVPTSFGGIVFPSSEWNLDGAARVHEHVYWKVPGSANEKGGRGSYRCSVRGIFHDTFPGYPDLYPNTMLKLKQLYEGQLTADFVHPTSGSFPAFIGHWKQRRDARVISGEVVDIDFYEDQLTEFVESKITSPAIDIGTTPAELAAQLEAIKIDLALSANDQSIFDAIQGVANSLQSIQDTADLYGNLVSAKIDQLTALCEQADGLDSMQSPTAFPVLDAVHDVWASAVRMSQDLQKKQKQLQYWQVKQTAALTAIAFTIYGDSSRAEDLASLNSDVVTDPLRVRAGTQLRYYPDT